MTKTQEIANTIWSQISIGAKMHAGARNPTVYSLGVKFNFGRGNRRWIIITLEPDDTYTVKAMRMTRKYCTVPVGSTFANVYAEMLSRLVVDLSNAK